MSIRAQRGIVNLEKDHSKEKDLLELKGVLDSLIAELTPATSGAKRAAVEEFYWLLEEYKISLFAQEVKTTVRISKKRLFERSREIMRMA